MSGDVIRALAIALSARATALQEEDGEWTWVDIARCAFDQLVNTPETSEWLAGVMMEAAHQRARWVADHDAGKTPFDWFWLIGYLSQKAAGSAVAGDIEKAQHHTISTAAALANWHRALAGVDHSMRPGIDPPPE
ncbi:hypothetical protein [Sphingomonas sp. MS122]|uniref:hypothetical protein n=1 Tax=Sphingomonas sp. MS122 TaxID=3412683 RepID=UPI003C2E61EB